MLRIHICRYLPVTIKSMSSVVKLPNSFVEYSTRKYLSWLIVTFDITREPFLERPNPLLSDASIGVAESTRCTIGGVVEESRVLYQ